MTKPIIRIYTSSNKFIDREMDDQEFAQYQSDQAKWAIEKTEAQAKAAAKSALLEKLGISEDEAKLLLS